MLSNRVEALELINLKAWSCLNSPQDRMFLMPIGFFLKLVRDVNYERIAPRRAYELYAGWQVVLTKSIWNRN